MTQRLPKTLLRVLALIAIVSFGASIYLENRYLHILEQHPIMVNLISGVVAFSSGVLVLSIGFNWLIDRQWVLDRRDEAAHAIRALRELADLSKGKHDASTSLDVLRRAILITDEMARTFELDSEPRIKVAWGRLAGLYQAAEQTQVEPGRDVVGRSVADMVRALASTHRVKAALRVVGLPRNVHRLQQLALLELARQRYIQSEIEVNQAARRSFPWLFKK